MYEKADQFSQNLETAVGIADKKITDWSKRINRFASHIYGPGGPNQFNGGGNYGNGNYDDYGNNMNQYNNNGGTSIMSAYQTLRPFLIQIGQVLNKIFMLSSKITSRLFMSLAAPPPRRLRPGLRPRLPAKPEAKAGAKAGAGKPRRYKKRGRARAGAGSIRKTATTAAVRNFESSS